MSATSTRRPSADHGPDLPVGEPVARGWRQSSLLAVAAVLVVAVLTVLVSRTSIFGMRSLKVSGNSRLSEQEIAHLGGLSPRTNVVWFSSGQVEARLRSDPWVAWVHVSRSLPSSVTVVVRERVAVGTVTDGDRSFLVAGDGVVLAPADGTEPLPVLMVSHDQVVRIGQRLEPQSLAMRVAAELPATLRREVLKVNVDPSVGVELITRSGVRVIYGDAGSAAEKAVSLRALLAWVIANEVEPAYVDISVASAPTVMPVTPTPSPSATGVNDQDTSPAPPSPPAVPSPTAGAVDPTPTPSPQAT